MSLQNFTKYRQKQGKCATHKIPNSPSHGYYFFNQCQLYLHSMYFLIAKIHCDNLSIKLVPLSNSTQSTANSCFLRPSPNHPMKSQILQKVLLTPSNNSVIRPSSPWCGFALSGTSNKPNLFNFRCVASGLW